MPDHYFGCTYALGRQNVSCALYLTENYFMIYRQKNGFLEKCSVTVTLHIHKNTQKSKFLLLQAFKWK